MDSELISRKKTILYKHVELLHEPEFKSFSKIKLKLSWTDVLISQKIIKGGYLFSLKLEPRSLFEGGA